ncbi:zinc finger chaperone ZPR1 isoform X2 [Daucus carota subsp. sativus]|uniref:zinc finger chaperone ZPR1 isoform X2 n=1 Tax=Daucus carota subsp. sativus TaxID=79200 RepID=UPI0007F03513|nr:PREDICTED: zinc finger protein ZPR1-like isoform X2 [Daucus carota subsp. sativus]
MKSQAPPSQPSSPYHSYASGRTDSNVIDIVAALEYLHFNRLAPSVDPSLAIKFYERTPKQQALLGYLANPSQLEKHAGEAPAEGTNNGVANETIEPHGSVGARAGRRAIAQCAGTQISDALFRYSAPEEVMTFPSTCGTCAASCGTQMFVTKIPYFQEVIVMASTCDACGYRNSELKAGGCIPAKGKKVIVSVKNIKDLSRDVIKACYTISYWWSLSTLRIEISTLFSQLFQGSLCLNIMWDTN